MSAARPLFYRKRKSIGGLAKSAPTSLLADQQKKRSDANQHRNQNTDDERNNQMPTRVDFSRSSAFFAPLRVPTRTEVCPWRLAPSSALLCDGLTMLATTVNLPARRAPSPHASLDGTTNGSAGINSAPNVDAGIDGATPLGTLLKLGCNSNLKAFDPML